MKTWKLRAAAAATVALSAMCVAAPAMAVTAGDIADSLATQTSSFGKLASIASFVIGIGLAIGGVMKLRAHTKNPNDPSNSISTAIILMIAGAAAAGIPSLMGTGVETFFGDGAQTTDSTAGFSSLN